MEEDGVIDAGIIVVLIVATIGGIGDGLAGEGQLIVVLMLSRVIHA